MNALLKSACGGCGRFRPGEPYSPDQCRLCWLNHHDPHARALWSKWPLGNCAEHANLPGTLHGTIINLNGCDCLHGISFPLLGSFKTGYQGSIQPKGNHDPLTMELSFNGVWSVTAASEGISLFEPTFIRQPCTPFQLEFTVRVRESGCNGTIELTFTS